MSDADTRAQPLDAETAPETSVCPGCGAVLAVVPGPQSPHPGASAGCAGLFEVTVRGLRDEAGQDVQTAALLQLATDAYDAQHLLPGGAAAAPVRLCLWLERGSDPQFAAGLDDRVTGAAPWALMPPAHWTMTVADLAADLDVVDLPALVRSWADAVWTDWAAVHPELRAAADGALTR